MLDPQLSKPSEIGEDLKPQTAPTTTVLMELSQLLSAKMPQLRHQASQATAVTSSYVSRSHPEFYSDRIVALVSAILQGGGAIVACGMTLSSLVFSIVLVGVDQYIMGSMLMAGVFVFPLAAFKLGKDAIKCLKIACF